MILENDMINGISEIDLSKGRASLGKIEDELRTLLDD